MTDERTSEMQQFSYVSKIGLPELERKTAAAVAASNSTDKAATSALPPFVVTTIIFHHYSHCFYSALTLDPT